MTLDLELQRCGWTDANSIWDRATDAMLVRDWDEFDRLMREFRSISKQWKSPAGEEGRR